MFFKTAESKEANDGGSRVFAAILLTWSHCKPIVNYQAVGVIFSKTLDIECRIRDNQIATKIKAESEAQRMLCYEE